MNIAASKAALEARSKRNVTINARGNTNIQWRGPCPGMCFDSNECIVYMDVNELDTDMYKYVCIIHIYLYLYIYIYKYICFPI